ncbi:trypsin-like serine peptidase [Kitasatospora cheerisanensis]|uniref:trypsin-like serine peptidase n=1 Tax=Kitasatospora cheerisanensis TaxID=81942 RepID=UPI00068A15A6|nr:hypothetical protein [Kitasatospora cheerisanensis]
MNTQHRTARRVRAAAAAALVTVLAVSTAACQSQGTKANPVPPGSSSTAEGIDVKDIQGALAKVSTWTADDWADWASKNGFKPEDLEAIKSFWDKKKLSDAKGVTTGKPDAQAPSLKDVVFPKTIPAKPQPHPYSADTAVVGKIFFQSPEGNMVCSGTVVSDPSHPGKSNLVWTAAHCVHAGKGGEYMKKLMFVPSYNKSGATSNGKGENATREQIAPLGVWAARSLLVMPQWTQEAGHTGSKASQFDYAVIRVVNQDGSSRSLEETVGGSVPIWFGAQPSEINSPAAYGYPADEPFDGEELEHCDSAPKPTPFVFDRSRPPMLAIGCNMTGGSSGGGWFTKKDGRTVLFSDTSIGDDTWLAGPNLGADAKRMFDAFVQGKMSQ